MARPRLTTPNYRLALRGTRYHVVWQDGAEKKRIPTGTSDRGEAEIFLARFLAGLGSPAAPPAPTISQILDGYLADRHGRAASYGTLEASAKPLRRHLGNLRPGDLKRERSRFYLRQRRAEGHEVGPADDRRRKPISDGTVLRELVTLRAALKWAQREEWIATVPYVEVPSQPPPRDRWLSREEANRLLAAAEANHVRVFLHLALYTAARRQAILQLRWEHVDLVAGLIRLGAAVGNKGRATVPIADPLMPILHEAHAMATCPYVVEHGGKQVADVKTGTRAAARRAGLLGVTPHILRHTAATWMAMAGVPMIEIAKFLGHKDSRLTETVYAKHNPDYLRSAARALAG